MVEEERSWQCEDGMGSRESFSSSSECQRPLLRAAVLTLVVHHAEAILLRWVRVTEVRLLHKERVCEWGGGGSAEAEG